MRKMIFLVLVLVLAPMAGAEDCFPECNDDYDEWVAVGKPASWCYPRQCHGDADGLQFGPFPVAIPDLDILKSAWKVKEPPEGPGVIGTGLIGADFDHHEAGSPFTGYYRVSASDLNILISYINKPGAMIPADCQDCGCPGGGIWLPQLTLKVDSGSGYFDPINDEIRMQPNDTIWIGIWKDSSQRFFDAYVIMTDGLDYGSWTGDNWINSSTVPGWTYYGTETVPGMDAWFAEISDPSLSQFPPGTGVNAAVQYRQDGWGDVTITLYDEFFEVRDSLKIRRAGIYVEAPNGGESLVSGNTYPITWDGVEDINAVAIEYSHDNGQDWNDVNTVPNTGSYDWLVPDVNSTECLVRVSDANDPDVSDTSDATFTIFICQFARPEWVIADLNVDCYIDFKDLAVFAGPWLSCGNPFDPNCGL